MENAFFAQHISTLNHAILVLVAPICGTNAANKVEKLCSTTHCLLFIFSSQICTVHSGHFHKVMGGCKCSNCEFRS